MKGIEAQARSGSHVLHVHARKRGVQKCAQSGGAHDQPRRIRQRATHLHSTTGGFVVMSSCCAPHAR